MCISCNMYIIVYVYGIEIIYVLARNKYDMLCDKSMLKKTITSYYMHKMVHTQLKLRYKTTL